MQKVNGPSPPDAELTIRIRLRRRPASRAAPEEKHFHRSGAHRGRVHDSPRARLPDRDHDQSSPNHERPPRSIRKWQATFGAIVLLLLALPHDIGAGEADYLAQSQSAHYDQRAPSIPRRTATPHYPPKSAAHPRKDTGGYRRRRRRSHSFRKSYASIPLDSSVQDAAVTPHSSSTVFQRHSGHKRYSNSTIGSARSSARAQESGIIDSDQTVQTSDLQEIRQGLIVHFIYDYFVKPFWEILFESL
jgi:hypothetical protein